MNFMSFDWSLELQIFWDLDLRRKTQWRKRKSEFHCKTHYISRTKSKMQLSSFELSKEGSVKIKNESKQWNLMRFEKIICEISFLLNFEILDMENKNLKHIEEQNQ